MTVSLIRADREIVQHWVFTQPELSLTQPEKEQFGRYFLTSTELWVGMKDSELVCVWGLAPASLLSNQAYLWLYTLPALKGNEFLFVRHSQRAVEQMLERYSMIVGHTTAETEQVVRWLRWLGAKFGEPEGKFIPFTITRRIRRG